ncbi:hypothetical protein ABN028_20045 [Actinopolymorpha sp. B17G11]|uniref:hypothetical protein n=1 Tax=Actinopolymorpha sp. B17G11 TaxID=3160861 RepID=UPI0032E3D358
MATADSKPDKLENKAITPDQTKPAAQVDEVKLLLAHHWTDDAGENHAPGETVTLPAQQGRNLAAQFYGKIQG